MLLFIQTVITSVLLTLTSFLINVLYFQGGVQASCSRFHCVWPPAAARCSSSSKGLLQLHRKLLLSQHISDGDRQPGIPWLVLPGAVTQSHGISLVMLNKSPYRCVIGQLYLSQWICVQSLIPQACTEMVMPMCTDGVQDMFEPEEWNFQAFSDGCNFMFGVRPRADWAGTVYGGKDIASHSNIIFR